MANIEIKHFIAVGKVMKQVGNYRLTLVEAVDIVSEYDPEFPKADFVAAVAADLHHNGIIKEPTAWALCSLDARVFSKYGRNYHMLDLLDSVGSHYFFRQEFPNRLSLEIVKNDSVA